MTTARLKAGFAEKDITPAPGTRLAAEFASTVAGGIESPLQAKALVLSNAEVTLALVTLDVYGLQSQAASRLQQAISQATALPTAAIVIVSSHTRGGPYTTPVVGWADIDAAYLEMLVEQVPAVVSAAAASLQDASLGVGRVRLPHLVYNHRLLTRNMKAISAWMGVPPDEVLEPEGPTDPDFSVIVLRDGRGFPIALVWNFAADNRFSAGDKVSAGLPFAVQKEVDARMGKHVPLFYLPGCAGNISFHSSVDAGAVASAVMAATLETTCDPSIRLDCAAVKMILPVRDTSCLWSQPDIELKAPQALEAYTREIEILQKEGAQAVPAEVKVFRLGQFALAALPGMPFVEFALAIKEHSPAQFTFVAANAGEHLGYIATQQAFETGGFETWPARSALVGPGGGEFMTEQACLLIEKLWKSRLASQPDR